MSKFKVIEKSRFIADDEMDNVTGGAPTTTITCTVDHKYINNSCYLNPVVYTTCGSNNVVDGYYSGSCVAQKISCGGTGITYNFTACSTWPRFSIVCGGEDNRY